MKVIVVEVRTKPQSKFSKGIYPWFLPRRNQTINRRKLMKKRFLSCFMALALCLTLLPTAVIAEGVESGVAQVTTAGGTERSLLRMLN